VIVDSSALIAILRREPDAPTYAAALTTAVEPRMSAASYVEAGIVADGGKDPVAMRVYDNLIAYNHIVIEPFTAEQARIAREAHRDFGRGSGHRARMNYGDCMTYALAKVTGLPLLYKGDDFGHTDVVSALD
jgi:ribonuclease VapC